VLAAEDTCSPGLSYPKRMLDIPQLVAAIDSRLADIAAEISALDAAKAELTAARDGGSAMTPQRSTRQRGLTVSRSRRGVVRPETVERLLADTSAGLSANAIAKHAGAGYARTLKLLHELEADGHVRRSGARRSTVWQMITDEERIAQRAAELERVGRSPTRRRGRARAS
jgi:hypothetical protein